MWNLAPSRHQVQIEPSRFVVSTTTPRKPYMRRPHLERHLVVGAEVDCLHVAPSPEIPEVDPMAVLSAALR